jgi:hypothetical protein
VGWRGEYDALLSVLYRAAGNGSIPNRSEKLSRVGFALNGHATKPLCNRWFITHSRCNIAKLCRRVPQKNYDIEHSNDVFGHAPNVWRCNVIRLDCRQKKYSAVGARRSASIEAFRGRGQ